MTLPRSEVQFYFDFISPFGYFASLRIDALAAHYGRQVEWTSMLLGVSVLKVMNIPAIVSLPLKGQYIVHDAKRYARRRGIAFAREASAPSSRPVLAGRAFAWAKAQDATRAKALAQRIFERYFVQCQDIGDPAVIEECVTASGLCWAGFKASLEDGTAAKYLKENVDRSLSRGVFGSPFFIVDDEPFFGVEKLELLEDWLAQGGW